jgi:hypothetical protein
MTTTFVVGCKKFFGTRKGQSLSEFAKEIRELTEDDRNEMAPLLSEALGGEVVPQLSK